MRMFIRFVGVIFPAIFFISFQSDSRNEYFVPGYPRSVYSADIDRDGDYDIITGHANLYGGTNPAISILENNGHAAFEITDTSKVFCGYQDNIFAIDVDNDGWPDIAALSVTFISDIRREYLRIYYNDAGNFTVYSDFYLDNPYPVTSVTHGDINRDGYPDFVFTCNWGLCFGVLYNDGTGHFGAPEYVSLGFPPYHVYCSDLDNDGRDDVILHNNKVILYYKLENGWDAGSITDSAFYPDNIQVADFDQDGLPDIVTNDYYGGKSHVEIFKNSGNKTFQRIPSFAFHGSGEIFPSDFNGDGQPDLMFGDLFGSFIWYNQGNYRFTDSTFVPIPFMGENQRNFYCEDLDNNGFKDILTVRSINSKIYPNLDIRFNDGNRNFTPYPVSVQNHVKQGSASLETYPNPFREKITFTFSLQETSLAELSVFDLHGRFITSLSKKQYQPGSHQIEWQGTDEAGRTCTPGIYVARLKVNGRLIDPVKIVKNTLP